MTAFSDRLSRSARVLSFAQTTDETLHNQTFVRADETIDGFDFPSVHVLSLFLLRFTSAIPNLLNYHMHSSFRECGF